MARFWARLEGGDEAVDITRRAQVSFLADHLGRWAETFALAVKAATPLPYYAALADLMGGWVRAHAGALGVAPDG